MSGWFGRWLYSVPPPSSSAMAINGSSSSSGSSRGARSELTIFVLEVTKLMVGAGVAYYLGKVLAKELSKILNAEQGDPNAIAAVKASLAKKLRRPEIETMTFDAYEMRIIPEVVGAEEITTGFKDIGGLDDAIEEVQDNVVLPLQIWRHHKSYASISPCPSGMLLYGPPGTGKTLIAKAIAKEAGATFISIKADVFLDKFVGESEKLAAAIFKLGRKLAPSIIFIDEIETLLQKRTGDSHHVVNSIQGIFLSEWDGLSVPNQSSDAGALDHGPVVVLGATNRPQDLDAAFLRRMPVKLAVPLPDTAARVAILQAQLRNEQVTPDVDLVYLAEALNGCSGADIKELIRMASLKRTKEITALAQKAIVEGQGHTVGHLENRPLNMADFEVALQKFAVRDSQVNAFKAQSRGESFNEAFKRLFSNQA